MTAEQLKQQIIEMKKILAIPEFFNESNKRTMNMITRALFDVSGEVYTNNGFIKL